jgi:hypothetical protein
LRETSVSEAFPAFTTTAGAISVIVYRTKPETITETTEMAAVGRETAS